MSGNDLPNILGVLTVVATLVVIWFAWQTVREARRTTTEERNAVTNLRAIVQAQQDAVSELKALVTKVSDLTGSTAQLVEATQRTAELSAEARDTDQRRSQIGRLRELLGLVDVIQTESTQADVDQFKATGTIAGVTPQLARGQAFTSWRTSTLSSVSSW